MSIIRLTRLFTIGSLVLSSSSSAQADEKALSLRLDSKILGTSQINIGEKGIRLELDRQQLVLAMRAPAWKVQYWNPRTKVYFEGDPSTWKPTMGVSTAMFRPTDITSLRAVSSRVDTLKGLTVRKYEMAGPARDGSNQQRRWYGLLARSGEYWLIDDKQIPASVTTVIQQTYGIPIVAGIPVQLKVKINKGDIRQELQLIGKSDKPAAPADFSVPPGFRRVARQEDVTNDNDVNSGFANFIR